MQAIVKVAVYILYMYGNCGMKCLHETDVFYFYSANHAPYTYIDVIFLGPLFSFIGIVISIITRKSRKIYPALWISGIISCMLGFVVCMLVFSMLIGGLICGLYMDWN